MDLLSNLPDDCRRHILSFLTTKEAACTSVLSKKWRYLFALVPKLELDESVFLHPQKGKQKREEIRKSFMDFVDRVLALQGDLPIEKFSLKLNLVDPDRLSSWICNVLKRGVSDIDLCINYDGMYNPPPEMFVSRTLVNLKIAGEVGLCWRRGAEYTFLPVLKRLRIQLEKFVCYDKLELLLPRFPVLEQLQLCEIWFLDVNETVSSATLTELAINTFGSRGALNQKRISFNTPSVRHFFYSDFVAADYPLVNMKSLVEARIDLMVNDDQIQQMRAPGDLRFRNVVKLMKGILNVQELHLYSDTLEVLSHCCESMPVFNKVKTLSIRSHENRGWQAMPVLLRKCPHLEYLCLEGLLHYETDKCGDACDCVYRENKGSSLISCPVKRLLIERFRGTMKEMHMIMHFLVHFPCLKVMKIFIEEDGPTELRNTYLEDDRRVQHDINLQSRVTDDSSFV